MHVIKLQQQSDFYVDDPDIDEAPELNYPVDIVFEDESTLTVNSNEELRGACEDCN